MPPERRRAEAQPREPPPEAGQDDDGAHRDEVDAARGHLRAADLLRPGELEVFEERQETHRRADRAEAEGEEPERAGGAVLAQERQRPHPGGRADVERGLGVPPRIARASATLVPAAAA